MIQRIHYVIWINLYAFCIAWDVWCHGNPMESHDTYFKAITRGKRYVTYPSGTAIGLLLAIALPVEVPDENLYFSLNFEANYNLPDNVTQYHNSDIARVLHGITRQRIYTLLEGALDKEGVNGHQCLLQTICEATKFPINSYNGLLGDLLHIVFLPSTSQFEHEMEHYYEAEIFGRKQADCKKLYTKCDSNILDLISELQ